MTQYFTNTKMEDVPAWNLTNLRRTKEYQEKRKKFIENKGGKCMTKNCDSMERLNVSHPQQYLKINYSKEKGKFYSVYYKLKYKEVCPRCYFDKAYEDIINFKSEIIQRGRNKDKKRRTIVKFKYKCPNCKERYKTLRRIKSEQVRIITELNDYQIPDTENFASVCLMLQRKINQEQWKRYLSFIDAKLECRDCHYLSHFIPITILKI